MSLMPVEEPRYEEQTKVLELWFKNVNPTKIAKELGIRRVDVLAHIKDWQDTAKGSEFLKDRVEDLLHTFDEHYSMLIQKAYEIIDEVDELKKSDKETMTRSQMLSQKKGALDLIAKLEKDRIDILQKSGLAEIDNLGDELARMEEEKQLVLDVLANHVCQNCKPVVMGHISHLLGGAPVDVVRGETVENV